MRRLECLVAFLLLGLAVERNRKLACGRTFLSRFAEDLRGRHSTGKPRKQALQLSRFRQGYTSPRS